MTRSTKVSMMTPFVAMFAALAQPVFADSPNLDDGVLVPAPVNQVFSPSGYDSADDATLTLLGTFPSGCWQAQTAYAAIDYEAMTITIDAKAWRPKDSDLKCTMRLEPFVQTINLGAVKPGSYDVFVLDRPDAETEPLLISQADAAATGPLYAPVHDVAIESDNGQDVLTLDGVYPYTIIGCMVMKNVKVEQSRENILTILPYAEYVDGPSCASQSETKRFTFIVPIGHLGLKPGSYLAHVRIITGGALDKLVSVKD